MSWNYRVCTKIEQKDRIFVVLPVYYDNDGNPNSWGEQWQQHCSDEVKDLYGDYQNQMKAFEKHIIDLDNFPNVYKGSINVL